MHMSIKHVNLAFKRKFLSFTNTNKENGYGGRKLHSMNLECVEFVKNIQNMSFRKVFFLLNNTF